MVNEITILDMASTKVEKYLQNECSDSWYCKILDNKIHAYWNGYHRFDLEYDDGDWFISGHYIGVDMIYEIYKILKNINYEQEKRNFLESDEFVKAAEKYFGLGKN